MRMLKKAASVVLASLGGSTYGSTRGNIPLRSHVIEASGSSEAWCVPPRLLRSLRSSHGNSVRLTHAGRAGEKVAFFSTLGER